MKAALGIGSLILILGTVEARDPFWPIDYVPGSNEPVVEAEAPSPASPSKPATRQLTDKELARLAEREAAKIKNALDRKATAVFGGRVHALVNGRWVTTGDSLAVEVLGNAYRLEILKLTPDTIELEAHRTRPGASTPTQE